jgi:hypothetical protein
MNKLRIQKIIILLLLATIAFPVFAEPPIKIGSDTDKAMYNQLKAFSDTSGFDMSNVDNPEDMIASIIQYILSFLGVIFIILVIYAGFLWMTAAGDEEQITKAKDIMISAVIGIVIVLSAYIITSTILFNVGGATGV